MFAWAMWVIKEEPKMWKRILLAPFRWFSALLIFLGVVTATATAGAVAVPYMVVKTALMCPDRD
jgi:hypothetical protein